MFRGVFDRVAEQVEDDAFDFLPVAVDHQFGRHVHGGTQVFLREHVFEILQHLPQQDGQVRPDDGEVVAVGTGLVEMQQLVGQPEHPFGIPFDQVDQVAVFFRQGLGAVQFPYRAVDQRERCTEFVRDIGEEGGTLLADLFDQQFFLFADLEFFPVDLEMDELADTEDHQGQQQGQIGQDRRPGQPGGWLDVDRDAQFIRAPRPVRLLDPDAERIPAGMQAGIGSPLVLVGIDPFPVQPFQLVLIDGLQTRIEILAGERERQLPHLMVQRQL